MIPKVSVCMITYNHAKYIREAIESVLKQKTDFSYELVIGEDCSTDDTKKIIQKYLSNNPKIIKAIFNKKNIGIVPNSINTLKMCRGKYVAYLEGDDYWTDVNKLKTQIHYLEKHPKCNISSHNCYIINEQNYNTRHEWLGKNHKRKSYIEDILGIGSGGATCSLVFRNHLFKRLPKWFYTLPSTDWASQVLATSNSYMYYFPKAMGVYRQHSDSATDFKNNNNKQLRAFLTGGVSLCNTFNKHFNYKYDSLIKKNLYEYMYPNVFRIYLNMGNIHQAAKYSKIILSEGKPRLDKYLLYKSLSIIDMVKSKIINNVK